MSLSRKITFLRVAACAIFALLYGCENPVDHVDAVLYSPGRKADGIEKLLSPSSATSSLMNFLDKHGYSCSKPTQNGIYIWNDRYFFPDEKPDMLGLITLTGYVVNHDATVERVDSAKVGKWHPQ